MFAISCTRLHMKMQFYAEKNSGKFSFDELVNKLRNTKAVVVYQKPAYAGNKVHSKGISEYTLRMK